MCICRHILKQYKLNNVPCTSRLFIYSRYLCPFSFYSDKKSLHKHVPWDMDWLCYGFVQRDITLQCLNQSVWKTCLTSHAACSFHMIHFDRNKICESIWLHKHVTWCIDEYYHSYAKWGITMSYLNKSVRERCLEHLTWFGLSGFIPIV